MDKVKKNEKKITSIHLDNLCNFAEDINSTRIVFSQDVRKVATIVWRFVWINFCCKWLSFELFYYFIWAVIINSQNAIKPTTNYASISNRLTTTFNRHYRKYKTTKKRKEWLSHHQSNHHHSSRKLARDKQRTALNRRVAFTIRRPSLSVRRVDRLQSPWYMGPEIWPSKSASCCGPSNPLPPP